MQKAEQVLLRDMTASRQRLSFALLVLLALCGAPSTNVSAQTSFSIWDGIYTKAQAERGRRNYTRHCKECHGEDLHGGETAAALVGKELISFWSETSVGVLFEEIRDTMPEENPGALSDREYADILAFLFQANKFPDGEEALEADVDYLHRIGISTEPE